MSITDILLDRPDMRVDLVNRELSTQIPEYAEFGYKGALGQIQHQKAMCLVVAAAVKETKRARQ